MPSDKKHGPLDNRDVQGETAGHDSPADSEIYRDGDELVAWKGATFPNRCVVCYEPAAAQKRVKITVRTNISRVVKLLLILMGPVFIIIWALCVPSAQLTPGLCTRHRASETKKRRTINVVLLLSIALVLISPFLLLRSERPRTTKTQPLNL